MGRVGYSKGETLLPFLAGYTEIAHRLTMTSNVFQALATVGTALMAAILSYFAGRGTRLHEWRLGLARERLLDRQRLYIKFLAEADRSQLAVITKGEKLFENIAPLLELYAEISLLSSATVEKAAKNVCDQAVSAIGAESHKTAGSYFETKSEFLHAARDELRLLEDRAHKSAR